MNSIKLKVCFVLFLCCVKSFSQEKDLRYFTEKAQHNSPLIIDYNNQISSNKLDSLLNRASYKTQVTGNLNASYAPVINGYGYDTALSNGQYLTGVVAVNQKILGKNRINSQAGSFQLIRQSLVLKQKIAIKDLNKSIAVQYITAASLSAQIVFAQKIDTLLHQEAGILKTLTQHSIYKQTDYLIFSATVKQQELVLLQLNQQYRNELSMLNYLSGETDTTMIRLKKPEMSLRNLKPQQTFFLKQFEVDSLKLINQNKILDYSYKPSLSLLGDAGYSSTFATDAYKNFGVSVGVGLTVPIYDGHQKIIQKQKNAAALSTIQAYHINFNRQYKQQLLMLQQKLGQFAAVEKLLESQRLLAEALIDANKKLLLTGDAQITEYVIAVNNLIAINNTISQNNISKLQIINEINYWSFNE